MALPLLRCCSCNRQARFHCDPARQYSERGRHEHKQKVVVVGIPNPFIWVRTRIYLFLIRTYFDKEFSIEEFTEGATQDLVHKLQSGSRTPEKR